MPPILRGTVGPSNRGAHRKREKKSKLKRRKMSDPIQAILGEAMQFPPSIPPLPPLPVRTIRGTSLVTGRVVRVKVRELLHYPHGEHNVDTRFLLPPPVPRTKKINREVVKPIPFICPQFNEDGMEMDDNSFADMREAFEDMFGQESGSEEESPLASPAPPPKVKFVIKGRPQAQIPVRAPQSSNPMRRRAMGRKGVWTTNKNTTCIKG